MPSESVRRLFGSSFVPSCGTVATTTPASIVWKVNPRLAPSPMLKTCIPSGASLSSGSESLEVR